ncbi:MAG TPA: penicillin-binding protein 1C, partial [Bradyrhizobium sp.]
MSEADPHTPSSCPGLSRASTPVVGGEKDVDGRACPGHDGAGSSKRRFKRLAASAVIAFLVVAATFAAWVVSLGPLPLEQARKVSTTIVDRNGKLLRAYAMADGRWR